MAVAPLIRRSFCVLRQTQICKRATQHNRRGEGRLEEKTDMGNGYEMADLICLQDGKELTKRVVCRLSANSFKTFFPIEHVCFASPLCLAYRRN